MCQAEEPGNSAYLARLVPMWQRRFPALRSAARWQQSAASPPPPRGCSGR